MMHYKCEKIDPFRVGLYFQLINIPSQFNIAWTKFTLSIQVSPLRSGTYSSKCHRHYRLSSLVTLELSIGNNRNFLIIRGHAKILILLKLYPQYWHPQSILFKINLHHNVDNFIQVNTRKSIYF